MHATPDLHAWVSVLAAQGPWEPGYLFSAIRSRWCDGVRRAAIDPVVTLDSIDAIATAQRDGGVDLLARQRLQRAMAELPPRRRDALVQQVLEGRTAQEIADASGEPRGTVLARVFRARARLRAALSVAVLLVVCSMALAMVLVLELTAPAEYVVRVAEAHLAMEPIEVAIVGWDEVPGTSVPGCPRAGRVPSGLAAGGWRPVGLRSCTLQGEPALVLELRDGSGRRATLFQAVGVEAAAGTVEVSGVSVRTWTEAGRTYVLASAP